MPEIDIHEISASNRKLMLENMRNSPAFALFLDRWSEVVLGAIETEIFDLKTDPDRTRILKEVRAAITGTHAPDKIVDTLIRTTNSENQKPRK